MSDYTVLKSPQLDVKPANRQLKFLIGAVILFVAIAYLVVNAIGSAGAYYMTVSELLAYGPQYQGKNVRVSGTVVENSVDYNAADLILKFSIQDAHGQIPVYFHGPKPDNFNHAAEAIVEGKYGDDGVLYAKTLLLKCPSRYEDYNGQQVPVDYEEIEVKSVG
ncbi:MAG: cytochrome c maturation protein CcmE [Caldilineales bacterium]|nr:cytochrome c maturation protein CcmE [Caldilineales bacterium]MDW8316642.1 cytochrome c maturation protein CcmE [Anaerolineae bacterium]